MTTAEVSAERLALITWQNVMPTEVASIITELQQRRSSVVTGEMVEKASAAHAAAMEQWRMHPEAPLTSMPVPMHAALTAALSSQALAAPHLAEADLEQIDPPPTPSGGERDGHGFLRIAHIVRSVLAGGGVPK